MTGRLAKSYKGFYIGSGISYDYYRLADSIVTAPKYTASVSPFIKKSTEQWSFQLGFLAMLDKDVYATSPVIHIYPDVNFSFNVVPSYVRFFAGLSGKLEKNEPLKIISENPFLTPDGSLFTLPNTDHELIVSAGLKGNTGLGGNYLMSASYSLISDMLFYYNYDYPNLSKMGNYFVPLTDDVELLQVHGEMSGVISDKISYTGDINLYKYTLTQNDYAWNKPEWDAKLGLKYNLRDKIILGFELSGIGSRKLGVMNTDYFMNPPVYKFETPAHINLNLSGEYRYSKILSFWAKFDNISYNRYYEWAFYPSQRFLCMLGFTYSL
jgi:hypothetical protein